MVPWQTQPMSPTYLLMNSKSPCKIPVVTHQSSIERMNNTTESFILWLQNALLKVINIKINVICSRDIIRSPWKQNPQCIRQCLTSFCMVWSKYRIYKLRTFGCDIYPITLSPIKVRRQNTRSIINDLYKHQSCNEMVEPAHPEPQMFFICKIL